MGIDAELQEVLLGIITMVKTGWGRKFRQSGNPILAPIKTEYPWETTEAL